ncbi:MAG TPA: hypothetical protein VF633_07020 [Brevundimonas sp.]|jgi:hypothetical protein
MLTLVGGGRLADVGLLRKAAFIIASDIALVAGRGFDELAFGQDGLL